MPDFIQIRDDAFTLLAYTRADKLHQLSKELDGVLTPEELRNLLGSLPYGQLVKIR